jgi:hypothetical protein
MGWVTWRNVMPLIIAAVAVLFIGRVYLRHAV